MVKRTIGSNINLTQHDHLVKHTLSETTKILTEGEKIIGAVTQQKPIINMLPKGIVITNKRVIQHHPKLFGTYFTDYLWKDLKRVHLSDHFFGSSLSFVFSKGYLMTTHLPKDQAKKVYGLAQAKEEEWVEKWRLRHIEEERARSGANHIMVGSGSQDSGNSGIKMSIKDRLLELESLLGEGLITQDEYQNKKMEILELI